MTCEIIPERWDAWLANDPVVAAATRLAALHSLKCLWIESGNIDQYNMVYGARRLSRDLAAAGVRHVYEEFEDNHSSIDYRLDLSLPVMVRALLD